MSRSQREVWLDQLVHPGSSHLNIGGGAYLVGRLDLALFRQALQLLVNDNQALRLVPHLDGSQTLLPDYSPDLEVVDLSMADDPHSAMRDWWQRRIRDPIDLGQQPPWRFSLLRGRDDLHGLTIQFHHLVMDGWGTSLIMQHWSDIYNALDSGVAGAAGKAGDPGYLSFIDDSAAYLQSESFAKDRSYWHSQLRSLPDPVIPRKSARRAQSLSKAHVTSLRVARPAYDGLVRFSQQHELTVFNIVMGAIAIYLSRAYDLTDLVIGVPNLNRSGRRYRQTLGMFVGVMPVPVHLPPQRGSLDLVRDIAATMRAALRHSRYPLSELSRDLNLAQSGRSGLFDVLLSFERQDYKLKFGEAELVQSRQLFAGHARYPLGITVCEFHADEDVEIIVEADESCFSAEESGLLGERLWHIVETLTSHGETPVESVDIMATRERRLMLDTLQGLPSPKDGVTSFIEQFSNQVTLHPAATALVWDSGRLDYAGLDALANALAARLQAHGIGPSDIVAMALDRSASMVAAVLAIAKLGAAFLPLDPDTPITRLTDLLDSSGAAAVLVMQRDLQRLGKSHRQAIVADLPEAPAGGPVFAMQAYPRPDDLAYVLFTSGSTGKPKGVMIEHGALARRLRWLSSAYGITANDRSAQATQITFDPSLIELLLPLTHGASVALLPPGRQLPESFAGFFARHDVTFTAFVPSTLGRFLSQAGEKGHLKLRVACCGGEVLPPDLARQFIERTGARLFNVYGPTEATIFATAWECAAGAGDETLPIGRPIADSRIYILDTKGNLLPAGVAGEVFISGTALARGYLNRPDLTAAAFMPDPFSAGLRMYKTGDRGWLDTLGNLHFQGRIDRQIKLRGYRIELGEIESTLLGIDGVHQAAAQLVERNGRALIHAWVGSQQPLQSDQVLKALGRLLPGYMVPAGLTVLASLPEGSTGKIDYSALPDPLPTAARTEARLPETRMEQDLLDLWRTVLARPELTIEDNFFEAGGDSLAAISILAGIEKMVGRRVPMYLISERPNVESLAAALMEGTTSADLLVELTSPNGKESGHPGRTPVYLAASGHGDQMRFRNLALALAPDCELRMLQPPSASTVARTVDLATLYADIVQAQGNQPCFIAGFSVGGLAALETARILRTRGLAVEGLFLIDTIFPSRLWGGTLLWRLIRWLVSALHIQDLSMNGRKLGAMLNDPGLFGQVMAVSGYRASRFEGTTCLVKSAGLAATWDRLLFLGWRRLLGSRLSEHTVRGMHGSMFEPGNVEELAKVMQVAIHAAHPRADCP